MCPLVAVLAVAALAPAAPVPKSLKPKVDDNAALVGIWRPAPGTRDESFQFTEEGKMRAWSGQGPGNTAYGFTWSIDPTTDPKRMTWGDASSKQVSFECVYLLDGDRLRINYVHTNQPLPAQVGSGEKGGYYCDLVRDPAAK